TRFSRDWSSDVCSSDLKILYSIGLAAFFVGVLEIAPSPVMVFQLPVMLSLLVCFPVFSALQWRLSRDAPADRAALLWFMMVIGKIGRASCRERGEVYGV